MLLGETKDLRETVSASAAFTISAATISVYDSAGTLAASGSPSVDNSVTTAQVLSYPFTPAATGFYLAVFKVTVGDEVRWFQQTVTVDPIVARFSYDETKLAEGTGSAAGRLALTRLLLADTVDNTAQPAIYTDAEVRAYLVLAANDPYEAAAQMYEGIAGSRGRIALMMSQQGITVHRHALKMLTDMAQRLRDRKNQGVLQTGSIDVGNLDEHLDSYRRDFSRFDQVPEVR